MRREWLVALVLLSAQAGLLSYAAVTDGMAYDELLYVASGYRQLALGDRRFGAEHPPLAQVLSAIPLLPLDLKVRDLRAADGARGWQWAYDFVHVDNAGRPLLTLARLPVVGLSLLLSLLLWRWSREMAGPRAGLAALTLAVFHPSLLAHGHLVTTDMAGAITMLAASWMMWRWCRSPGAWRALSVAAALGVGFATRLTAALLIPVFLVLCVERLRSESPRDRARFLLQIVLACAILVPLIVWAAYGFRYGAWPGEPEPRIGASAWAGAISGTTSDRVLSFLRSLHVFPAGYLASMEAYLIKSAIGHQAYLLGQISANGWWYYYLTALLVKNTPGFLVALVVAGASWRRLSPEAARHWLLPAVLIFTAASLSRVQVGERYILAFYPYAILIIASMTPKRLAEKGGAILGIAVLLLHALPGLQATRDGQISYFNGLVGRDMAHLVLADSNLDWGQDLPRLKRWSQAHPERRLQLAYWGTDSPDGYGIVREDLPGGGLYPLLHPPERPMTGWVAISPTLAVGLYPPPGMLLAYRSLLKRSPDDRAGVFLIYNLGP